ncbi:zinc finger, matrin-type 2 [Borealophlyctis nickersoniae]|nr:zinc finger, matrin-type 2 [Borealophlyctis nickersoniae]
MASSDKGGGYYGSSAGDTDFRRKWDREEYERKARERAEEDRERDEDDERRRKGLKPRNRHRTEPAPERTLLQAREEQPDLEANLNKTQVVQTSSIAAKQPGYYCKVCDCTLKDSVNYLDHINGKKHQRNMGMSMKVERSTADQVRAKLESLKRKAAEPELDFDARVEKAKQEEREEKRAKKEKKKEKKRKKDKDVGADFPLHVDPDLAATMGFGGFGSAKN